MQRKLIISFLSIINQSKDQRAITMVFSFFLLITYMDVEWHIHNTPFWEKLHNQISTLYRILFTDRLLLSDEALKIPNVLFNQKL